MPLIETFIATAWGFSMMLDTGCEYKFYRVSEDFAVVTVCDEFEHAIYQGKVIE